MHLEFQLVNYGNPKEALARPLYLEHDAGCHNPFSSFSHRISVNPTSLSRPMVPYLELLRLRRIRRIFCPKKELEVLFFFFFHSSCCIFTVLPTCFHFLDKKQSFGCKISFTYRTLMFALYQYCTNTLTRVQYDCRSIF